MDRTIILLYLPIYGNHPHVGRANNDNTPANTSLAWTQISVGQTIFQRRTLQCRLFFPLAIWGRSSTLVINLLRRALLPLSVNSGRA